MLYVLIFILSVTSSINALQHQIDNKNNGFDLKPILSIIQRSLDQTASQQQQRQVIATPEDKPATNQLESQQKQDTSNNGKIPEPLVSGRQILQQQYAPVAFIEPQLQYPGFGYVQGKQPIPR